MNSFFCMLTNNSANYIFSSAVRKLKTMSGSQSSLKNASEEALLVVSGTFTDFHEVLSCRTHHNPPKSLIQDSQEKIHLENIKTRYL